MTRPLPDIFRGGFFCSVTNRLFGVTFYIFLLFGRFILSTFIVK
ncbi:hypothetical protein HMPREF9442_02328 [Paraprevotella xylaniphila YIT 11841]|uniref:Uncharacterized protein n=1 Tax=Paraprevotella xylaniphila YIT 11841 TaxID=762982 RepID=F3QW05_9BACT|nr:hypothetical protein HMPREF9442_02328 [Paraprevotella xylaniphila YIT 11841]